MQDLGFCLSELFSNDDDRAELAAQQIPSFGDAAIRTLQETMTSKDVEIRWWSIRALAEFHNPGINALLIRSLEDRDPDVRQCAAQGLVMHA
jgi:HEAT repeat protein